MRFVKGAKGALHTFVGASQPAFEAIDLAFPDPCPLSYLVSLTLSFPAASLTFLPHCY